VFALAFKADAGEFAPKALIRAVAENRKEKSKRGIFLHVHWYVSPSPKLCIAICDSDAGTAEKGRSLVVGFAKPTELSPILRKQCANFAERQVECCTSRATSCDLVMENA